MTLITILFCNFLSGILCVILANAKNRSCLFWGFLALPFGLIPLFVLLFLDSDESVAETKDET